MKNYKYFVMFFLITLLIVSVYLIPDKYAFSSIDEADTYREQGQYEKAIDEYKKYEDFYNYYLLKNLNNPKLYREYSRLLSEILLKIAETYNDWKKPNEMTIYCNKIISLSDKIGKDDFIDSIRKRAEELLKRKSTTSTTSTTTSTTSTTSSEKDKQKTNNDKSNKTENTGVVESVINVDPKEINKIKNMTEEDYIKLSREDEKSLLSESDLTEKELDKILKDIIDCFKVLESGDNTTKSSNIEDNTTTKNNGGYYGEPTSTIEDNSTTNLNKDKDKTSEDNIDIVENTNRIELKTKQSFNPLDGPVLSQFLKNKNGKNQVVVHLTTFNQYLEDKIERPYFVEIYNGEKKISTKDNKVKVDSLTTEEMRIYITLGLSNNYKQSLSEISNSIMQFLMSIPIGYQVYLTFFNKNKNNIDTILLNNDTIPEIDNYVNSNLSNKLNVNDMIKETYNIISENDNNMNIVPRFLVLITDSADIINVGNSKRANELSIPIYLFNISDNLYPYEESALNRLTTNTFGTYSYGKVEPQLNDFLYSVVMYLVQSSFIISWEKGELNTINNLKIKVDFVYDSKPSTIVFDTSFIF